MPNKSDRSKPKSATAIIARQKREAKTIAKRDAKERAKLDNLHQFNDVALRLEIFEDRWQSDRNGDQLHGDAAIAELARRVIDLAGAAKRYRHEYRGEPAERGDQRFRRLAPELCARGDAATFAVDIFKTALRGNAGSVITKLQQLFSGVTGPFLTDTIRWIRFVIASEIMGFRILDARPVARADKDKLNYAAHWRDNAGEWQDEAQIAVDDIGGWRVDPCRNDWQLANRFPPQDQSFVSCTRSLVSHMREKYPQIDTTPLRDICNWIEAWYGERSADSLPDQTKIERTLNRARLDLTPLMADTFADIEAVQRARNGMPTAAVPNESDTAKGTGARGSGKSRGRKKKYGDPLIERITDLRSKGNKPYAIADILEKPVRQVRLICKAIDARKKTSQGQ